ncbi:ATP-dependent RNA helicase SUV3, mitochondrial precursor [Pochonia chlamydosporia 170]|uniref:RNA helicase n=1 Tax=Pochonia chlamydosporia 170 TaxID=1380566 RepID=A0A179FKL3_METCM|nr:ATP-dependent RNA helicase SUV3, mitochondrial precursor [Pochonia chlamydosporia 170]OAQ65888.1 ATP-dependent RNA helicase SUV3, mitochondrial precursor [Pochonia chlamydosporia 170]
MGIGDDELNRHAALFMNALDHAFMLAEQNVTRRDKNPLFWSLRDAFITRDIKGLTKELQYSFQSFLVRQKFSKELEDNQKRLLDLRFPHEWFPATRMMQRTIHVHVGPTNSGKTYNALKALENSKRGVYAGPLRLLATEVYQRLQAKGRPCALITGEEVRIPEDTDQYFSSCTVEMVPLNMQFDVAVIDEIQMIADPERGGAWTTALLGVQAKEVHLCGEDRTVRLLEALCASIGDKCIVHRYERLSPLKMMNSAIQGDYNKLQKGDAIVAFSRLSLHVLKRNIETHTGRRCAIIYGSLPPEVRVQQAALFNDPNNDYDFVVASDAIGMGLNLEIRRVVLESITKFDGNQNRLLSYPEIKQIGGRAGRYRTAQSAAVGDAEETEKEKVGLVTTMDRADLRNVAQAFQRSVPDIDYATIQPPAGLVERFASYFPPDTPLSFILMRIKAAATVGSKYRLNISSDALEIADIIQDLPLTIYDRLTFCYLPVTLRAEGAVNILRALARVLATNSTGDLLDIKEIPLEFLDVKMEDYPGGSQQYLAKLEALHVAINQYVWLSYRYAGMFRSQDLAFHVRQLVEEKLISTLERLDFTEEQLENRRKSKRLQAQSRDISRKAIGEDGADELKQERGREHEDDLVLDIPMRGKTQRTRFRQQDTA